MMVDRLLAFQPNGLLRWPVFRAHTLRLPFITAQNLDSDAIFGGRCRLLAGIGVGDCAPNKGSRGQS
jgi:hypothetical protein